MKISEHFKLEIPYNFDKDLITILKEKTYLSTIKDRTAFVYMPCYQEDADNTRRESPIYQILAPHTREEYAEHVHLIRQNLQIPVAVLLQYGNLNTAKNLQFYLDLGINYFIVGSDEIASYLKRNYQDVTVIASITKKLTFDEIMSKPLDMYDIIVLDFPFERGLNRVKQLPKTHEYSILANNQGCLVDCNQCTHWISGRTTCRYYHDTHYGEERALTLCNADDNEFAGYVSHLKLQGRDTSTEQIISYIDQVLCDDNSQKHDDAWLNYADTLGLFDGTYRRDIRSFECKANRSLRDFTFYVDTTGYSWTEGKTYHISIDMSFGYIGVTADNGVMYVSFPIYAEVSLFLKEMFKLELCSDDAGGAWDA